MTQAASHPEHELEVKNCNTSYRCSGCKMQGYGKRYSCEKCNYNLHEDCMFPSTRSISHEFYQGFAFSFFDHPQMRNKCCVACGKLVSGFNYHCEEREWDLHPCCINLSNQICVNNIDFHLSETVSPTKCMLCNEKRLRGATPEIPGWSYVSGCKKYRLHVYCVSEMVGQGFEVKNDDSGHLAIEGKNKRLKVKKLGPCDATKLSIQKTILETTLGVILGDHTAIVESFLSQLVGFNSEKLIA